MDSTIYCELILAEHDLMGYTTYVFKCLENNVPFGHTYTMVTRLPNWNHRELDIGEIGYLTYKEVTAGEDKWYDQTKGKFIPYNYTNIYFVKFVRKQDNSNKDIII